MPPCFLKTSGGKGPHVAVLVKRGAMLGQIGVEVSEQLHIIPQQVRVIRDERVKYASPCLDGGLRLVAKPSQIIPQGVLSEAALAWVINAKYLDWRPCGSA